MAGEPLVIGTIAELLETRAAAQPDRTVYTYVEHRLTAPEHLTTSELLRSAREVAGGLRRRTQPGDRVIVAPGLSTDDAREQLANVEEIKPYLRYADQPS